MVVMARQPRPTPGEGRSPFEEFVAATAGGLLRLATVTTADAGTAQDVVQTVLERTFRGWGRISGLEHPEAYVRRMVVNEAVNLRRRAKRIVLTDEVPDLSSEPDRTGHLEEFQELTTALRRLPPRRRAAIALRYFCDLSDAQIAEYLNCREVTVRGYIHRGLRSLRIDLDSTGSEATSERRSRAATARHEQEQS